MKTVKSQIKMPEVKKIKSEKSCEMANSTQFPRKTWGNSGPTLAMGSDVTENQSDVADRKDSFLQTEFNLLAIYSGKQYFILHC